MRLRKPNLAHQIPPTLTSPTLTKPPLPLLSTTTEIAPLLSGPGLTDLAVLPNGFGSMFVGTKFVAYICLNNESEGDVSGVSVTSELRTANSKSVLSPKVTRRGTNETTSAEGSFTLSSGEALHQIIEHSTHAPTHPPATFPPYSCVLTW